MENLKKGYVRLKNVLQERAACVLLAGIVLLFPSCRRQGALITERQFLAPTIRIDTTYRWKEDTVYRIETDSVVIETLIHDTLIRQRFETKPLYIKVRDTILLPRQSSSTSKVGGKKATKERNALFLAMVGLIALWIFLNTKRNK